MKTDSSLTEVKINLINIITRVNEANEIIPLIKDGLDIIGTTSTAFELVRNVYLYSKKRQFESYTTGLFFGTHPDGLKSTLNSEDLNEYFSNPANLEHMSQIIDASLHSRSVKCSAILGYYTGGLLSRKILLEYKDTIIVNALRIMNDRDLKNFIALYKFVKSRPDLMKEHDKEQLRTHDIQEDLASLNIPIFDLELTIEKLKSVQAIGYDIGGYGLTGNAWGTFKFNINSDYLFELVSKFENLNNFP